MTESRSSEPGMVTAGAGQLNRLAFEAELLRREQEALRARLGAQETTIRELRERLEKSDAEHSAEQAATREATLRELREELESRAVEALRLAAEQAAEREAAIRDLHEQLERRIVEAHRAAEQVALRDVTIQNLRKQLATVQSQLKGSPRGRNALSSALAALPAEATVVVAGGGDDLPDLGGRRRWHFPQTEDGAYAGHHPADSTAAIAHLEAVRAGGGDYLLFPRSTLWWLDRYKRFRQHLESRYQVVVREENVCIVFALRQPASSGVTGWRTKFEEVVTECRSRLERDPAILDWNTGLELATNFPQHTIFSPPTADRVLPYLDHSIDIVAVGSSDPASVAEARRVAEAVVVTSLTVDWLQQEEEAALPTASIVIPTYNGIKYTETCLSTLMETLPRNFEGEIIVVDDASTDETQDALRQWEGFDGRIKALRNPQNAGFVTSCNRGANVATGEIIVFLNNDTLPLPGWLSSLLQTFRDYPDAGAAGGKLVYPNGRLQEAGGVIFAEGSGANFGRGDYEVDAPLYSYVREVDYCSGALLATRRSLFEAIGGFDTRYVPAYYEDTDYCFAVREEGFQVYYQPDSTVVHLEGGTSGTNLSSGAKQYQVVNRAKFVEKWASALERQRPRPARYDRRTWYALASREGTPAG